MQRRGLRVDKSWHEGERLLLLWNRMHWRRRLMRNPDGLKAAC